MHTIHTARLLESIPAQQGSAQPVIQDAAGPLPPTRPKFEMPDMTGSACGQQAPLRAYIALTLIQYIIAALLARVQSFLPQLQQANTTLPTDHAGKSAFELIEENSDDEEDEGDSKDIKHARDEQSDEDSDEDETADVGPQIVMVSWDNVRWRYEDCLSNGSVSPLITPHTVSTHVEPCSWSVGREEGGARSRHQLCRIFIR